MASLMPAGSGVAEDQVDHAGVGAGEAAFCGLTAVRASAGALCALCVGRSGP